GRGVPALEPLRAARAPRRARGRRGRPRAARDLAPREPQGRLSGRLQAQIRLRGERWGVQERGRHLDSPAVRRKAHMAAVFAVLVLLGVAGGAYALDSSRSDQIAPGVTIGGVDVGGMTANEARRAVRKQ